MFKENKYNELDLFKDSFTNTSKRAQKMIEQSWAEVFANIIFPAINEQRFKVLFHKDNGCLNTPINYILGALILKELFGLTDEDLKLRCHTDISFHHALHYTTWVK